MYGLDKTSKIKEIIEKQNDHAIRYRVIDEKIDLVKLRAEKERLEAELSEKEPTEKELLEFARTEHPFYYKEPERISARIAEIEEILK